MTAVRTLSTFFPICGTMFFSTIWSWHALFPQSVSFPKLSIKLSFWGPTVSSSTTSAWALSSIRKSFRVSFLWLTSLLLCCPFYGSTPFVWTFEINPKLQNQHSTTKFSLYRVIKAMWISNLQKSDCFV